MKQPWPEHQLPLTDLGSDPAPEDHRNRDDLLSRGGRVIEKKQLPDRQIDCPKCGQRKTPGLPCPHCVDNAPGMDHT